MTITLGIFLSSITLFSGILTIIMGKNPINSVVYLVSCFVNCALVFILIGVDLIGYIYIIVYVGAIAILFIFVIMMMDIRNEPESYGNKSGNVIPLALILAISALIIIVENYEILLNDYTTWEKDKTYIWETLIQSSMGNIIQSVGYIIYTDLLSLLLLVSLVLLMVMISVISLVCPKV
jgi:NADH:ubiquinone oxidoreductase subunit 6 (subunit J)